MSDGLAESVLRCVRAAGEAVEPKHQALVDLAVRYAIQIDAGIDAGGQEATKALYLGPHLLKALEALGLTPVVTETGQKAKGSSAPAKDELSALRDRHRGSA